MIADAALSRAAGQVILHAVAFEYLNSPVVHAHGDGNNQLPLGLFQDVAQSCIEFQMIGRGIELLLGDLKRVQDFARQCGCTHALSLQSQLAVTSSSGSCTSCTCRTMVTW